MRNWTLGQLRMLAAVAENGSMRGAAEQLGYTVGAISQQMSALQKEAGQALFIRDGRRLVLSDAGRILHRHVLGLLAAETEASAALDDLGSGIDSVVRLGVFGSAAIACAVPALHRLAHSDPQLRVDLVEVAPDQALPAVISGRVDVSLALEYSNLPARQPAEVSARMLVREDLAVVSAAGFGIAGSSGPEGSEWILPAADSPFGRAARLALADDGITPSSVHTVTDTALALALAAAGLGATVATASMLALHPGSAVIRPLAGRATRSINALVRPAMLQRTSVERLLDAMGSPAAFLD